MRGLENLISDESLPFYVRRHMRGLEIATPL